MTIRELIDENELEMLLTALRQYEKKCRAIADRPIQGYGRATEVEKKEQWREKAEEADELITKISYEFI